MAVAVVMKESAGSQLSIVYMTFRKLSWDSSGAWVAEPRSLGPDEGIDEGEVMRQGARWLMPVGKGQ